MRYKNDTITTIKQSRENFVYAPSQWETTLHCNVVSHWLGAYTKWSLQNATKPCVQQSLRNDCILAGHSGQWRLMLGNEHIGQHKTAWDYSSLQWRYNERDGVSNHKPRNCLLTQVFIQARLKENIKALCHWPLCGEVSRWRWISRTKVSDAENVSIWWRHHVKWDRRQSLRPTIAPLYGGVNLLDTVKNI